MLNLAAHSCTTPRQNADNTELLVCSSWHPWHGLRVSLVRVVRRSIVAVAHVRCDIDGRSRLLELPLWMLDRSTCAQMQLAEQPQVRVEHLRRLRELLLNVVSSKATMDRHLGTPSSGDANAILGDR